MVVRIARLSAVRSPVAPVRGPFVRSSRRVAPPRTVRARSAEQTAEEQAAEEQADEEFDAAAGAARILIGPAPPEPQSIEPQSPIAPPETLPPARQSLESSSRGLSGANWLSGPSQTKARARRDARRAVAARTGRPVWEVRADAVRRAA
ncbi:hypothetical protein [Alienimonas chondri]|uniref:Uncharacterized protein n=1 Tax=Alienimonas chondri TaxID=2681879 RepID=A0ABX1VJ04_9PLAN|nr:hypothetical protein [Alienimonas chondri]NNJ28076.1 hypothetical protein [Alienimonas chondri]